MYNFSFSFARNQLGYIRMFPHFRAVDMRNNGTTFFGRIMLNKHVLIGLTTGSCPFGANVDMRACWCIVNHSCHHANGAMTWFLFISAKLLPDIGRAKKKMRGTRVVYGIYNNFRSEKRKLQLTRTWACHLMLIESNKSCIFRNMCNACWAVSSRLTYWSMRTRNILYSEAENRALRRHTAHTLGWNNAIYSFLPGNQHQAKRLSQPYWKYIFHVQNVHCTRWTQCCNATNMQN